ncbi:MAG: asparagine synthase (glutamine-hydrolyzing), partial [Acidithiobacillus sp.]|nr:asparagine synthase (glutamine-hydrolyzing) [Acidithiobacillus sp.]
FATRRLSIIDMSSGGNQPMHSARYTIAFNGEIYNHLQLRGELENCAVRFNSTSDTETVLRAIDFWGVETALRKFNGMYALAVWDRELEVLILARDPMGVKPLYYAEPLPRHFYFSSELRPLRRYVPGSGAEDARVAFMLFGFIPSPMTPVEGIYKLKPGEALTICPREGVLQRTTIIPQGWLQAPDLGRSYIDRVAQVRQAVTGAVTRQLISDVPVGLLLSGGVDSSIIAATAAEAVRHSFTVRYGGAPQESNQDAELAAMFAQQLGFSHHEVVIDPATLVNMWDRYRQWMDEPMVEPNFLSQALLAHSAREHGVKVLLSGDGSDELFHGYNTYLAVKKGLIHNRVPGLGPLLTLAARITSGWPQISENLKGAAAVWRQRPSDRYWIAGSVIACAEEVASKYRLPPQQVRDIVRGHLASVVEKVETCWPGGEENSHAELISRLELAWNVADHYNLRLDKATMRHSVEARVPFQDLELANVVLRLAPDDKVRGHTTKAILKDAFRNAIPPSVLMRPKQAFQAPIWSWLQGPLRDWALNQYREVTGMTWEIPLNTPRFAVQFWAELIFGAWCQDLQIEFPVTKEESGRRL